VLPRTRDPHRSRERLTVPEWTLGRMLVTWIVVIVAIGLARRRRAAAGIGLVPAYLLNLAAIHWFGAAIYLLPAMSFRDPSVMLIGFEEGTYGMLAFALGSIVGWPLVSSARLRPPPVEPHPGEPALARMYAIVGVLCYVLLVGGRAYLPTINALVAAGQQLVVLALCLGAWNAWQHGSRRGLIACLLVTASLPIVTIVSQGYLSYGAGAALVVCVFVASFFRPRHQLVVVSVVVGYAALSFFVSYMRDRGDIRDSVWGGRPLEERLWQITETILTVEPFDPSDVRHLGAIDARLNQNHLVGMAVGRMRWTGDFANGATLGQMLSALVPRVLWPNKPYVAGSGDLVSVYTGLRFGRDTSVGIGQVMEFYVNFGTLGVLGGFFVMGILVTGIDEAAAYSLRAGDWRRLAPWALVGFSLLQVGGALAEVATTAAASMIVAIVATRLRDSWSRRLVEARPAAGDRVAPGVGR